MTVHINSPLTKTLVAEASEENMLDEVQHITFAHLEYVCNNPGERIDQYNDHHDPSTVMGRKVALEILRDINPNIIEVTDVTLSEEECSFEAIIKETK